MIQSPNTNEPVDIDLSNCDDDAFLDALPMHGAHNPSTEAAGTTPGSFALKADIGGPRMFSSPDTPGMPQPSTKTAWDFLPDGWTIEDHPEGCRGHNQGDNRTIRAVAPADFTPVTQLEHARLGTVTPQMKRVAEREPHLTAEQVRDEVAAGRLVIPANIKHLEVPTRPHVHRTRLKDQGQRQHGRLTRLLRHR